MIKFHSSHIICPYYCYKMMPVQYTEAGLLTNGPDAPLIITPWVFLFIYYFILLYMTQQNIVLPFPAKSIFRLYIANTVKWICDKLERNNINSWCVSIVIITNPNPHNYPIWPAVYRNDSNMKLQLIDNVCKTQINNDY